MENNQKLKSLEDVERIREEDYLKEHKTKTISKIKVRTIIFCITITPAKIQNSNIRKILFFFCHKRIPK